MTESGDADVRNRAAMVARELLLREKTVELARLKAEKTAVKETLEASLAEAENRYRAALADLLKAAPERETRRFLAIGYVRRDREGFFMEKGGVVLHRVDSLRYDLEEMLGRHVGVNGRRIEVDPRQRLALLRVDSLEILD
jgi:multidrug efflux pump subunit AcrA (membrane-fusion protein)